MTRSLVALVVLAGLGCGGAPARQTWENTFETAGEDLFLVDDDFVCLADERFDVVDGTRVWNPLGHQLEAVEHARGKSLGAYPVGTVVQLFHDEASVKRGRGFSAETGDWEFLTLASDDDGKSIITSRGTTEVRNVGGTCLSCHDGAAAFDYTCFTNAGCGTLPFFIDTDVQPATDDPRCASR
ncbi:MAG: hypothetical protein Q8O67_14410 [Deltaproteobacteria bacterium]|nr:hypothetical protein [Deltaproteobacteria bacterium]